ncbi:MAG TPA: heme-binding protein [Kofleriaceae bacterium]|nr:heme-binding protein [Kofleriaceae bacterium]
MKTRSWMTIVLGIMFSAVMAHSAQAQLPNPYGPAISVETARKVAATAAAEGKKNGWTVAVAIVDPDGELVFFERMDNTQSGSVTVAQEKARSAARFKRPTKAFEDALVGGRQAILSLPGAIPLEGGIPLLIDGKIVGAIGVSGGTSQQDGVCAQAAADTLGKAPPGPAAKPAPAPPPKK